MSLMPLQWSSWKLWKKKKKNKIQNFELSIRFSIIFIFLLIQILRIQRHQCVPHTKVANISWRYVQFWREAITKSSFSTIRRPKFIVAISTKHTSRGSQEPFEVFNFNLQIRLPQLFFSLGRTKSCKYLHNLGFKYESYVPNRD